MTEKDEIDENDRISRTEKRKSKKIDDIIDKAEQIIKISGFESFSLRELASELSITKNALYYYFSSKDEIILHICIRSYEKLIKLFKKAFDENLKGIDLILNMGEAYFKFATEYPHYRDAFHYIPKLEILSDEIKLREQDFLKIWVKSINMGQADGSIRKDINPMVLALLLGRISSGLIDELHHSKDILGMLNVDMDYMVNTSFDILKKGLQP